MKNEEQKVDRGRRAFFGAAAKAGAGVAVVAAAPAAVAIADDSRVEKEPLAEGYQLSAHNLRYYKNVAS